MQFDPKLKPYYINFVDEFTNFGCDYDDAPANGQSD